MPVVLWAQPGSYGLLTGLMRVTGEDQFSGAAAGAGVAATVSSSHPPRHAATARKRFVGTPASFFGGPGTYRARGDPQSPLWRPGSWSDHHLVSPSVGVMVAARFDIRAVPPALTRDLRRSI